MSRPPRAIRVDAPELEGRLLMASLPVPGAVAATQKTVAQLPQFLGFVGTTTPGTSQVTQVVTQQAGTTTVTLANLGSIGPLQVEVKTDPSSPAVGVNVGAVDQLVTFSQGQSQATLSVPILAGAPNPGEVDVTLTATPVNPPTPITSRGPLVLRILASDASIPPTITTVQGTPQGIVLTFSKPMDPARASNVNNYAVRATSISTKTNPLLAPINFLTIPLHFDSPGIGASTTVATQTVPLRAAEYDPATNSVTLIPTRRLTSLAQVTLTQGSGSKTASRPGHPSDAPPGLTDLEGNPINGGSTPGQFSVGIESGDPRPVSDASTVLMQPSRAQQRLNRQLYFASR